MATTMVPPTGTADHPTAAVPRVATVRANLLPDEVLSARQAVVVRKQVLGALGLLVVLLVAGYGFLWLQTNTARHDLAQVQRRNAELITQQNQFRPVVSAESGAQRIQGQLRTLMAGDLPWGDLIQRIGKAAPNGVGLTDLDGSVTTAVPGAAMTSRTVPGQVGTLSLTGTAHDKRSVAAFADQLAKVKGLAYPLITSVASQGNKVTFSIGLTITKAALGGRYAATTPSAGGN